MNLGGSHLIGPEGMEMLPSVKEYPTLERSALPQQHHFQDRRVEQSGLARRVHTPEVTGSNPVSATKISMGVVRQSLWIN